MNLEKEINNNHSLLILISRPKYTLELTKLLKILDKKIERVCYVNLNKSYQKLKNYLNKIKIKSDNFFVMGLNKPPKNQEAIQNYRYIESADNFGGISMEFSEFVYWGCKFFLIDSLLDMSRKTKKNEFLQFINTLIVKAKIAHTKVIFLALNENIDTHKIKELKMVFDETITDPN